MICYLLWLTYLTLQLVPGVNGATGLAAVCLVAADSSSAIDTVGPPAKKSAMVKEE